MENLQQQQVNFRKKVTKLLKKFSENEDKKFWANLKRSWRKKLKNFLRF